MEITEAVINRWKEQGMGDANLRVMISSQEWSEFCALAIKGVQMEKAAEQGYLSGKRMSQLDPFETVIAGLQWCSANQSYGIDGAVTNIIARVLALKSNQDAIWATLDRAASLLSEALMEDGLQQPDQAVEVINAIASRAATDFKDKTLLERAHGEWWDVVCEVVGIDPGDETNPLPILKGMLTFERIRKVSAERRALWHHAGTLPWTLADWGNALAGEVGELCNIIKKIRRIDSRMSQNISHGSMTELMEAAANEIADVFCYLDILAERMHVDMAVAIRTKFNAISVREGFPQRL